MSVESIVSRPLPVFDVPEMEKVKASFTYNFFVSDETIDESGNDALNGNLSARFLRKGTVDTTNLNARIPRFATLTFGLKDTKKSMLATKSSAISSTKGELEKALRTGKIFSEDMAAGLGYESICVANECLPRDIENMLRARLNSLGLDEATPLELLSVIAETSDIDSNLLESMLPPSLKDETDVSETSGGFFEEEAQQSTLMQLNSFYAPLMKRTSVERGSSLGASQAIADFLLWGSRVPKNTPHLLTNDEYLFDIPYTSIEASETEDFVSEADVVGFIIEKKRVYKGVRYPMPPIITTGQQVRTLYDSQVAYGQTYEYVGRTIAKFRVPATSTEGEVFIKSFLLASKPAPAVSITIKENRRPEPPGEVYTDFSKKNH